ncbi:MAG: hypothetical protein K6F99_06865, partial [Lachnospiraceae bacterium]|nr:hypothetical protein [Lachnospiraceae bacterium]
MMGGLFNISIFNMQTIIIDLLAIFLMAGLIYNSSIFRKRNNLSDRIFFIMCVICMVTAFFDASNYMLEKSYIPGADKMIV